MIDYQILRQLVLEALKATPDTQIATFLKEVQRLADRHNVFPSEDECREHKINYTPYKEKMLHPDDELKVCQIAWDLIVDRVLTIGTCRNPTEGWPFFHLTEFGYSVAEQAPPTYYDPEGYLTTLESFAPEIDPVIKQYALEGLNCFRQRLFFAAAVMFGAAAEKAVLLLLQSIGNAETDPQKKSEIDQLLERPSLPKIFETIQSTMESLIKAKRIPYSVHEGSTEHMLSLFEMIRVQRNDAVHPTTGEVDRTKVFLTIQALPAALEVAYHLIEWFTQNKI
jgi:hypothetical protein